MPHCYDCNTTESVEYYSGRHAYCYPCYTVDHMRCHHCDSPLRWDYRIEAEGRSYCQGCHQNLFVVCHGCNNQVLNSGIIVHNGNHFCADCAEQYQQTCCSCNRTAPLSDIHDLNLGFYCESCYEEQFVKCFRCNGDCRIDDAIEGEGGWLCSCCESETSDWGSSEFNPTTNSYDELESQLTYGIEIETSSCRGFSALSGKTIWGCTNDFSISGKEFISPPLCGDEGLNNIREFCSIAADMGWSVDSHCGLHLHMGVEHLSTQELKRIALAYYITQELWSAFVSTRRAQNNMCASLEYNKREITSIETDEDWDYFVGERDRFDNINWRAYMVHGTMELRLLNGTLDADHICNWIKMHTKFVDCVKSMSATDIELMFDGSIFYQFSALTEIIGVELSSFYMGVADTHGILVRENTISRIPF